MSVNAVAPSPLAGEGWGGGSSRIAPIPAFPRQLGKEKSYMSYLFNSKPRDW